MKPEILKQDIGDAELQYLDYPGQGPTIIMLHATGFLPWLWHPIAREMAGRYHVMAPYFCDHRSVNPETGLSWELLADDLVTFIDRLEISRPMLVGHSMGGAVATLAEALEGPIASRIVLIEPIFLPPELYDLPVPVEMHPLASKAMRRRNGWKDEVEARQYLTEKELFRNWDKEMLDLYLDHGMSKDAKGQLTLACAPRREAALFMGALASNPWKLLESISCPVLLIEGEDSENRTWIDLEHVAELIPNAELKRVPGAGHLVPMEKPREVLALILEFFEA
jgi:lipase